jgi:hypothetical protein
MIGMYGLNKRHKRGVKNAVESTVPTDEKQCVSNPKTVTNGNARKLR